MDRIPLLLAVLVTATGAIIGIGWHFSSAILEVPEREHPPMLFTVLHGTDTTVTLPPPPSNDQIANTRISGRFNLMWENGYGRLGPVLHDYSDSLVRRITLRSGRVPHRGDSARIDRTIYHTNPQEAHGIAHQDVRLNGPVGPLKAWWMKRSSSAAVLMLHGRRPADRTETLRTIPTLVKDGYSVLSLAYRNHGSSTRSPSGFIHYGATEWRDAVTGLRFLSRQGIDRVVLYGFSLGGAVALETAEYLRRSSVQVALAGLILDSPLIDPLPVFQGKAQQRSLPLSNLLARWAAWIAGLRAGIDWDDLNQRRDAGAIEVPLLLIHGTADRTVPVELSDAFVDQLGVPARYKRLDGVEHTQA